MSLELHTYRTARTHKRCNSDSYRCRRTIQPGDRYLRASLPPMADPNSSKHWWSMNVCSECMTPADREKAGLPAESGGAQ